MGDAPLKAPGGGAWRVAGGAARLLWSRVGEGSRMPGAGGAGRGCSERPRADGKAALSWTGLGPVPIRGLGLGPPRRSGLGRRGGGPRL